MLLRVGAWEFEARAWGPDDGPPALLLHGFPDGTHCWDRVGPQLGDAGVRAVAVQQRGYSPGARPADVADYSLDHLVADAAGFVGLLADGPVDVLAHDWGAVVGWALAARRPDLVRTLTVLSVGHPAALATALATDPDQRRRSEYIGLFRSVGKAEHVLSRDGGAALHAMLADSGLEAAAVTSVVERLLQPGALTAALGWYRALRTGDLAAVPDVEVPTTFVWGAEDPALGRTGAEGTAGHVLGPYRFEEVGDVGHWLPERRPDVVVDLFLDRSRR